MKRLLFYLLIILSLVVYSCEKVDGIQTAEKLAITSKGDVDNKIGENDVLNYINTIFPKTKSDNILISPYTYKGDTVLFEVKHGNSYRIFTTDRRLPVIIAYSENGADVDISSNSAFRTWIEEEAKYLLQLKNNLPDTINNRHTKMWDRVKSKNRIWTKAEGDPEEEEGYWRWLSTDTINVSSQVVGHLVTRPWHQVSPYNAHVPFQFNSTERCAAGCVAVAGAHILHYTNNKLGLPATIPSSGSCSGWYSSPTLYDYSISFTNRTSNAWDLIDNNNTTNISILIGWIAHNIGTKYGASSDASPDSFLEFLNTEGVNATFTTFNHLTAFNRVFNNREPVYISSEIIYDNGTTGRHSYIMDRAKLVTYTTESLYEYVPHANGGVSTGETKYETDEILDYYVSLRMGWETSQYTCDDIYIYLYEWDYPSFYLPDDGRKMMYNFKSL